MRCYCCNETLTPAESRLKFQTSGTFADTCRKCLDTMDTGVQELNDNYDDEDIISMDELLEQEEGNLFDNPDDSEES